MSRRRVEVELFEVRGDGAIRFADADELTAPLQDDLSKGSLDAIEANGCRAEQRSLRKILLPDENAETDPSIVAE